MLLSPLTLALLQVAAPTAGGRVTAADVGAVLEPPVEISGAPLEVHVEATIGPGAYQIVLTNTGTGFQEAFLLQLPPNPSRTSPSPLLVAFHKFGNTAFDISNNTTFEEECYARNWFLVAPLGAGAKNFSALPAQINTEIVLDLLADRLGPWIDRERVYGVGFSMGATNAMNFAARHVDPDHLMFAAVVNHTGGGALAYTYEEQSSNQAVLDFWYGGPPDQFPFEYARSSLFEVFELPGSPSGAPGPGPGGGPDPGGGGGGGIGGGGGGGGGIPPQVLPELGIKPFRDLVRNLTHVPLYFVRGDKDPLLNHVVQFDRLADHVARIGGDVDVKIVPNVLLHEWATLGEKNACNWLAQHRLVLPNAAVTLADHDGRYFHFDVAQDAGGAFTPFEWRVDSGLNRLSILRSANLRSLLVRLEPAGLDPTSPLTVALGTWDGTPDTIVLAGYPAPPSAVARDGEATSSWTFDAAAQTLTLVEQDGLRHIWRVTPAE